MDFAGLAEAAQVLGVSPSRVRQLRAAHRDFPRPVQELQATPLWRVADLVAWNARRQTAPGRPATLTAAAARAIASSAESTDVLADRHGVSRSYVYRVRSGSRWGDATAELRRLRAGK